MHTFPIRRLFAAAVLAAAGVAAVPFTTAPPAQAVPTIVYVVPGGAGTKDGTSWANAKDLLPATLHAAVGQQLWVKEGTYMPYILEGGVQYFKLYGGVGIYGGFDGTETDLAQRDWLANPTILDGDIGAPGVDTDNASHVVESSDADGAVLDGFTITHGYANSGGRFNNGAGFYLDRGNPQLSHLVITQNLAHQGGGIFVLNGNPTLTDVTVSNNFASDQGGGIWADHVTLDSVTVTGNHALSQGGGIFSLSSLDIDASTITGNEADGDGVIEDGEGGGGGIYSRGHLHVRTTNVSGNTAGGYGGGIFMGDLNNTHEMELANVFVTGNDTNGHRWPGVGGGIAVKVGSPTMTNVVISGNRAANMAGGLHTIGYTTLVNATIAGNTAPVTGGVRSDGFVPTIRNSILWGNGQSYWQTNGESDVLDSIVQGGLPGAGNLDVNPKFVAPVPPAPSQGGDVLPDAGSPAINKGSNASLPAGVTVDARGFPRINGGTVDMGGLERQGDVTAPTVVATAPGNGAPITTTFTVTFSEAVTGVGGSTFKVRRNGTVVPGTVTTTPTTATFTPSAPLVPNQIYDVSLLAGIKDLSGNALAPSTRTIRTSATVDNTSPALIDKWDRDVSAPASGGYYAESNQAGSKEVFRFIASDVAVRGARGPDGGYANIYIDGAYVGYANFYASVAQAQKTVFSTTGLSNSAHTLEIRPRGTHPAAATDSWVRIDAFKAGGVLYQENGPQVSDYFRRVNAAGAKSGNYESGWHATSGDTGARPSFQITCRGNDLKVYGTKTPTSGSLRIYVDDVAKATVSLANATILHQQLLFDSAPLSDAQHTIRMEVIGTPTGAGSDTGFDYLRCG